MEGNDIYSLAKEYAGAAHEEYSKPIPDDYTISPYFETATNNFIELLPERKKQFDYVTVLGFITELLRDYHNINDARYFYQNAMEALKNV